MNARRQGFTLVELLVVLVVGSIVLGAVFQTLTTQEKTNRQQLAIVATQENVRAALDILSADLREISASQGDIGAASATSIQFRALRKAGIVCGRDVSLTRDWIDVAVLGQTFTTSDTTVIFDDGPNDASSRDDSWLQANITNTSTPSTSCVGNPVSSTIERLRYPSGTLATVDTGGLVRSYKTYEYSLVDVGGYGKLIRTRAGVVDTLVESLATTTENGLKLQYFNVSGTEITDMSTAANRANVMRIQIIVKGKAGGQTTASGKEFADSLIGQVYLRGNARTN